MASKPEVWPPKAPKLLLHKPPKGQLKKAKGSPPHYSPAPNPSPPPPSMDSSSSSSSAPSSSSPPPIPQKKPFLRRIFPFLLAVNFAVGAYILTRTTKKSAEKDEEAVSEVHSTPAESAAPIVTEKASVIQSIPVPVKVLPPIPEDEQHQLFKWILEEKRKVKTRDPSEKKKIDEEKAVLKQYIRAKSIPSL